MRKPLFRIIFFILSVCCVQVFTVLAQRDRFNEEDPLKWDRADFPTPVGILVTAIPYGRHFQYKGDSSGLLALPYDISLYADSWQLGYYQSNFGNKFRLTLRNIAKDKYYGTFIEIGSTPEVIAHFYDPFGWGVQRNVTLSSVPVYSIGQINRGCYESYPWLFHMVEWRLGYYDAQPLTFSNFFLNSNINLDVAFGVRVPADIVSGYVGLIGSLMYSPTRMLDGGEIGNGNDDISPLNKDTHVNKGIGGMVFSISAYLSLAINVGL